MLDMGSFQLGRYRKVRLGDRPESHLTRVSVISQACSRLITAHDGKIGVFPACFFSQDVTDPHGVDLISS